MGIKNLRHPMEPQKTTSPLGCPIDHQGTEHSGRKVDLDRRTGTRLCFAHATFLYVNTEFASISPWIKSAWDIRTPCSFRSRTISEYEQTSYQPSSVSGWVSYCIFPSTIRHLTIQQFSFSSHFGWTWVTLRPLTYFCRKSSFSVSGKFLSGQSIAGLEPVRAGGGGGAEACGAGD